MSHEATYEDILTLPEHLVGEVLFGELITHPRPAPRHALSETALADTLFSPFHKGQGGPGGWWILVEPELHLDSHILVPDLAGWRRTRMPKIPDTAWFEIVPDWVCEILSPSTARCDRVDKMPLYAEQGVEYLWLIDPDLRTLESYALQQKRWTLMGTFKEDQSVTAPPFAEVPFSLTSLWT